MKPLKANKQKESKFKQPVVKTLALSLLVACLTTATAFAYGSYSEGSAQDSVQTDPAGANRFQASGPQEPTSSDGSAEAEASQKRHSQARQAEPGHAGEAGEVPSAPASQVVPQDLCSLGLQQSPMIKVSYTISTMPACLKKMLSLDYLVLPNDETPQDLSGFSGNSGNSASV